MAACDFCGAPRHEVGFMVASKRGGCRVAICDGCIDDIAVTVALARAAQNAAADPKSRSVSGGDGAAGTSQPEPVPGDGRLPHAICERHVLRDASEAELRAQRASRLRGLSREAEDAV